MKEYDQSVDLFQVKQIYQTKEMVSSSIVIYDLETAGFRHNSDILQIGAIRFDISKGQQTGCYLKFLQPTAPIPASSAAVHQLLEHGGKLCNKSKDGSLCELIVEPARVVLNEFMSWFPEVSKMGEEEPKQG